MTVFAEKLDGLAATAALASGGPIDALAAALRESAGRTIVAVGSGGSAVAAEYLARCRSTLGLGSTVVCTPLEFAIGDRIAGQETWLFSAGANNPDVAAAFRTAVATEAGPIRLLTAARGGSTARAAAEEPRGEVMVLPVADPKDGFLATHSLVATVTALLLASDLLTERPDPSGLQARLQQECPAAMESGYAAVSSFQPEDTVVILLDPQLRAIGTLLETSLWEAGIAPVQKVDFRNFAHGRHVWAARRGASMFALALIASETRDLWRPISALLPAEVRQTSYDFGNGGRLRVATGLLAGLAMIRAMGDKAGVDPGRPGAGDFARPIYDNPALLNLVEALTPGARHKRRARQVHDPADDHGQSICAVGSERLNELQRAHFRGLVLDYDGTIVSTSERFEPPRAELIAQLVRLVDEGVRLGIATGRGGSAGEVLRRALPERIHPLVLVGYYNGGYVRTLDVDIRDDPPEMDPALLDVLQWLDSEGSTVAAGEFRRAPRQLTIDHAQLHGPAAFMTSIAQCPPIAAGRARVLSSHHSFDIVPASATKISVVGALRRRPEDLILCIGDSGSPLGNDHELLSEPHALSVGSVCGGPRGCWSLFGHELTGPDALHRILKSLHGHPDGATIDLAALFVNG